MQSLTLLESSLQTGNGEAKYDDLEGTCSFRIDASHFSNDISYRGDKMIDDLAYYTNEIARPTAIKSTVSQRDASTTFKRDELIIESIIDEYMRQDKMLKKDIYDFICD